MQALTEIDAGSDEVTNIPEYADMPECIAKRWQQALRVDRADDWKEAAVYCGDLAISMYRENDYNPDDPVFKSLCRLGRIAFRRAGSRLAQISARPVQAGASTDA